jgi:Multicopper oxidase
MTIRRPLIFVAVAAVLLAAATAGALAPGLVRSAKHPSSAAATGGPPAWIAGESRRNTAAGTSVTPSSRTVRTARTHGARPGQQRPQAEANRSGTKASRSQAYATRAFAQAAVTQDLCAVEGMFDGTIPIWGFAPMPASNNCADATAQLPGPELHADAGDVVTLNVTNNIPGQTISIEVPGIDFVPGSQDADYLETVTLTFTPAEGTYLYASSGDAGRQQAMGLYGALVVGSGTAGHADGVDFDVQQTLVLSEIDPAFNADPDGFDLNGWHPTRWLINGQEEAGAAPIDATAGARVLLRYVNAGPDHNTMGLLGLHQRMVGRDGFTLANPFDVVSETFPAGETGDALVTVPAATLAGTRFPLYNQNGKPGMSTFLQVPQVP